MPPSPPPFWSACGATGNPSSSKRLSKGAGIQLLCSGHGSEVPLPTHRDWWIVVGCRSLEIGLVVEHVEGKSRGPKLHVSSWINPNLTKDYQGSEPALSTLLWCSMGWTWAGWLQPLILFHPENMLGRTMPPIHEPGSGIPYINSL